MRKLRLNASISARFTGPSHFASLADSTTEAMAKNCSRWPSIADPRRVETVRAGHMVQAELAQAAMLRRMPEGRSDDRPEGAAHGEAGHRSMIFPHTRPHALHYS